MDKQRCLEDATERELLDELTRRRQDFLRALSNGEIEEELVRRGVDLDGRPPKLVEK